MRRQLLGLIALFSVSAALQPASAEARTQAPSEANAQTREQDTVSIYAGVYTTDQAARGETIYRRSCAGCHSPSEWEHGRLLSQWSGESAYALVDYIRNMMPMDAPGSLSLQAYTDIFAYFLRLNSVPMGDAELMGDESRLNQVRVEYRPE